MSGDDDRRYARFYYQRFRTEYPEIYRSSAILGDFMKLLVESELAWPNHPEFPASVRKASIATLLDAGLITLVGYGYRVRGFDAERKRRSDHASRMARARWHPRSGSSGANGHAHSTAISNAHSTAISNAQAMLKTKTKEEDELSEG